MRGGGVIVIALLAGVAGFLAGWEGEREEPGGGIGPGAARPAERAAPVAVERERGERNWVEFEDLVAVLEERDGDYVRARWRVRALLRHEETSRIERWLAEEWATGARERHQAVNRACWLALEELVRRNAARARGFVDGN